MLNFYPANPDLSRTLPKGVIRSLLDDSDTTFAVDSGETIASPLHP